MIRMVIKCYKMLRKYNFIIIIGIMLSTVLMFSLIQSGDSIMKGYSSYIHNLNPEDINLYNLDNEKYDSFISISDKKEIDISNFYTEYNIGVIKENDNEQGNIVVLDNNYEAFLKSELIEGKLPENDYEICIENNYNLRKQLKIGDKIDYTYRTIDGTEQNKTFVISGIIEHLDKLNTSKLFFINKGTAEKILPETGSDAEILRNVHIQVEADKYSLDKVVGTANILMKKMGFDISTFYKNYCEVVDKDEIYQNDSSLKTLGLTIKIISLIIALNSIFYVFNFIYSGLVNAFEYIGIMRNIGMSNRQLIGFLQIEQLFNTLIGGTIGILLGYLLNIFLGKVLINNIIPEAFHIKLEIVKNPGLFLTVILLDIIICEISLLLIKVKLSKLKPVDIGKYNQAKNEQKYDKKRKVSKKDIETKIGRILFDNKIKDMVFILSVTLSCILVIVILNMSFLMKKNTDDSVEKIADYELDSVWLDEQYIDETQVERLKENDKIDNIYTLYYDNNIECISDKNIMVSGKDIPVKVIVYSDNLIEKIMKKANMEMYSSDDETAILTVPVNSQIGSDDLKITLKGADLNVEIPVNHIIKGNAYVCSDGVSPSTIAYLIINEKYADKIIDRDEKKYTSILLSANVNRGEIGDILNDIDPENRIEVRSFFEKDSEYKKQTKSIKIIIAYILLSTIITMFTILISIIKTDIRMQKKIIGIIRALGIEKKIIIKIISKRVMKSIAKGLLYGVFLSIPLNYYIMTNLSDKFRLIPISYLLPIILIALICYLICDFETKKIVNNKIVDLVEEE